MKKIALIALACLALAGCDEEQLKQEKAFIDSKLPRGCKFVDLGSYGHVLVNAVICDGVTTTNFRYGCGKNCTRDVSTVAFGRPD